MKEDMQTALATAELSLKAQAMAVALAADGIGKSSMLPEELCEGYGKALGKLATRMSAVAHALSHLREMDAGIDVNDVTDWARAMESAHNNGHPITPQEAALVAAILEVAGKLH